MARYSFGILNLTAGISLLPVMIGLFGFPEIVDAFNPETRTIIPVSKFSAREGLRIMRLMFVFGILGIIMRQLKYPAAPFLLGIILGNMADENLRRALILNKGSITSFFTRPISLFFIVFILALLLPQFPIVAKLSNRITQKWGKKN